MGIQVVSCYKMARKGAIFGANFFRAGIAEERGSTRINGMGCQCGGDCHAPEKTSGARSDTGFGGTADEGEYKTFADICGFWEDVVLSS